MIYFDNAATTKPSKGAVAAANSGLCEFFANPMSRHKEGTKALAELKKARDAVAASLHTAPQNIIFTNSGTQSVNVNRTFKKRLRKECMNMDNPL